MGKSLLSADLNPFQWWRRAKKACGWSTPQRVSALSVGGNIIPSPPQQADVLNRHFQQQCSAHPAAQQPTASYPLGSDGTPRFEFQLIAADDVLRVLRSLPGGKSCGLGLITNELLKLTGSVICLSLADLFNTSLSSGVFPDQWKESVIAPVLKDGTDATQPMSYRPIALLSCLSKVFGRLVHEQLLTYCREHGFLPDQQFGFLRGRSTE